MTRPAIALPVMLLALLVGCGPPDVAQPTAKPVAPSTAAPATAPAPAAEDEARGLEVERALVPWKGDFDQMIERKHIRVLVPYSRTLYFNDKGVERGVTVETVRDFERYLNQKYVKDKRPVTVIVVPTTREKLLTQVVAGVGDIAAGNITITESRLETVDFAPMPISQPLREIVVTGPQAPPLATLDDLSGNISEDMSQ